MENILSELLKEGDKVYERFGIFCLLLVDDLPSVVSITDNDACFKINFLLKMVQLLLQWMSFHTCKPGKRILNRDFSYVTKRTFFKKSKFKKKRLWHFRSSLLEIILGTQNYFQIPQVD